MSFRTWWSTLHPRLVYIDRSGWLSHTHPYSSWSQHCVIAANCDWWVDKNCNKLEKILTYISTDRRIVCLPMLISSLFVSHQVVCPLLAQPQLFPTLGLTVSVNNDVGDALVDLVDNTSIQQRGPSPHGVGHSCTSSSHFKASNT